MQKLRESSWKCRYPHIKNVPWKTCFTPLCDCTKGAIDHFFFNMAASNSARSIWTNNFLGNSNLIRQAIGQPGQALVPTPTLETNKQIEMFLENLFFPIVCDCTKGAIDHFSSIWWLQIQHALFEQTTAEKSAVSNSRACLVFFFSASSYVVK